MSPDLGRPVVNVTARAEKMLAAHLQRVADADARTARERGAMYDAIDELVAAGELTIDAAARAIGVSRPTLNRGLAANRKTKAQRAD